MLVETLEECTQCGGWGGNVWGEKCNLCNGDGAIVTRKGLPNGRTEVISWSESIELSEPEPDVVFCKHGYGGFFKCPKACHSKGPVQDYEDREQDINYFLYSLRRINMMFIITQMKAETNNTPSGVAFRKINDGKSVVSVKWQNNEGYSPNRWIWCHNGRPIEESTARSLLQHGTLLETSNKGESETFTFANHWTMKRETGVVRLAKNGGIGVDAYGKWVLRDDKGEAVDMDKYRDDILDRYEKQIGKPIV